MSVFKIKRVAAGLIEWYNTRLVAKGFMQRESIDFTEVFAPVSKHNTLRTFLALAAADDLELHQLHIKTAFVNGELKETNKKAVWKEEQTSLSMTYSKHSEHGNNVSSRR